MSKNQVDILVRRALFFARMFTKSFGKPENLKNLKKLMDTHFSKGLATEIVERADSKMIITKNEYHKNGHRFVVEGNFMSPLAHFCPSLFPSENVKICHWKGIFAKDSTRTVISLAPTGDHGFWLRQVNLANHLLADGVSTILLENPFYGRRKPKAQFRSALENVADLFIMGAALITECVFLFRWLSEREDRPSTLGITGVSLGGFMASLAATNTPQPIATVPCLTWTTAAPVFVRGALSNGINWKRLDAELDDPTFREEIRKIPNCDWLHKLYLPASYPDDDLNRAQKFMWVLMDEFTNLDRYSRPVAPDLAKFVVGNEDAYIETRGAPEITDIWPGVEVLRLNTGHIQGFLRHSNTFRTTILEMLARAEQRNLTDILRAH